VVDEFKEREVYKQCFMSFDTGYFRNFSIASAPTNPSSNKALKITNFRSKYYLR
jgi:hypothetical protein